MRYPIIVRDRPIEPIFEHEIRLRAYDLFLRRGRGDGHAVDDWLEAEFEVVRESQPYNAWSLTS
jgi:Protein of unknown function (DUF2934)